MCVCVWGGGLPRQNQAKVANLNLELEAKNNI